MNTIENRIHSFHSQFDEDVIKILSINGFYMLKYNNDKLYIKCVYCGIEVKNWNTKQNPIVIHEELSRYCTVNFKNNFSSLQSRLDSFKRWEYPVLVQQLAEFGFVYTQIKDIVKCFSCGLTVYDWDKLDNPRLTHSLFGQECNYMNSKKILNDDRLLCNICMELEKNTCFVPCGHIVCCLTCSSKITDTCPICNSHIQNTVKLYL